MIAAALLFGILVGVTRFLVGRIRRLEQEVRRLRSLLLPLDD